MFIGYPADTLRSAGAGAGRRVGASYQRIRDYRADAHGAPHEAAAGAHPEGRDRPLLHHRHRSMNLEGGPALYEAFRNKTDNCTKVVFKPHD